MDFSNPPVAVGWSGSEVRKKNTKQQTHHHRHQDRRNFLICINVRCWDGFKGLSRLLLLQIGSYRRGERNREPLAGNLYLLLHRCAHSQHGFENVRTTSLILTRKLIILIMYTSASHVTRQYCLVPCVRYLLVV